MGTPPIGSEVDQAVYPEGVEPESLYERFHWLYAFCREHLFRDDTEQITASLWPDGVPPESSHLLEIGCGPGFYSCRLAARFKHLRVTGIDYAARQLRRARSHASERQLANCHFAKADALNLSWPGETFDAIVASRMFTILPKRERAIAEMYRVLRPGGRLFIAEPRSMLRAAIPLYAMWLLARLTQFCRECPGLYREPRRITILNARQFKALIESQPWGRVRYWQDTWYQYAVCEQRESD